MLILEIALGIVLAIIILVLLPYIIVIGSGLLLVGIVLAFVGLVGWGIYAGLGGGIPSLIGLVAALVVLEMLFD